VAVVVHLEGCVYGAPSKAMSLAVPVSTLGALASPENQMTTTQPAQFF
jgi:hypothetical protein